MLTYMTLDGKVYDMTDLTDEECAYFDLAYNVYYGGMAWGDFANTYVYSGGPLLRASGGKVSREVFYHPRFRALRDLADRLGIAEHVIGAEPGDDITADPLADEWLTGSEAAQSKGMRVTSLHEAIKRGDVVARPAREGGSWLVVSSRSLDHWTPNPARQAVDRASGRARNAAQELPA